LNFLELIKSETQGKNLEHLDQISGNKQIDFCIYDNGCHLDKYYQNNKSKYDNLKDQNIRFFVDRFHQRNHVESCVGHNIDKESKMANLNSQKCEQLFYIINKHKHMVKHMGKYHFRFFFLCIFNSLNKKTIEKLQ